MLFCRPYAGAGRLGFLERLSARISTALHEAEIYLQHTAIKFAPVAITFECASLPVFGSGLVPAAQRCPDCSPAYAWWHAGLPLHQSLLEFLS